MISGQLPLLDSPPTQGRARATDPITSVQSAAGVDTARVDDRIATAARGFVDFTFDEMAVFLGIHRETCSSACSRVCEAGLIETTGEKRMSARDRPATVYRSPAPIPVNEHEEKT